MGRLSAVLKNSTILLWVELKPNLSSIEDFIEAL